MRSRTCSMLLLILSTLPSEKVAAENSADAENRRGHFNLVVKRAQDLASRPFQASPELPAQLRNLNYDTYRLIAFEHEKAIWKRSPTPFWLEFFHRGYLYSDKVA